MTNPIPTQARDMWAQRERRIHHYLWHSVRNGWFRFSQIDRDKITHMGWAPPRPAFNQSGQLNLTNNSGEDFLYMHRQMIHAMNTKLAQISDPSYPKVTPWPALPDTSDTNYPVPPVWDTGDPGFNAYLNESKSDDFFNNQMRTWESQYRDPTILANMSLGELGARLEFTIHNRMHIRWCSQMQGRPSTEPTNPGSIDPAWDAPAYNWLADTYSSHVHPTFWKLHGWIDDCITHWANANSITGPIPWSGTWVGPMPPHPQPDSLHALLSITTEDALPETVSHRDHDHHGSMGKVLEIVQKSGVRCNFYDPVSVPELP